MFSFDPLSLPRARRVVRSAEFRQVYQNGTRVTSRFFVAFCLRSGEPADLSRFGLTVPRALGKAVQRNRIRRRLRETIRSEFASLPAGWVIVFNPRRTVLDVSFDELRREVNRVFTRCKEFLSVS
ncbi:MAG: ribonuclease P protein component [Acidobacteriaceae bacterium]|nr:ribonuclease P protein component [Acidobacteriaceae bacterium]